MFPPKFNAQNDLTRLDHKEHTLWILFAWHFQIKNSILPIVKLNLNGTVVLGLSLGFAILITSSENIQVRKIPGRVIQIVNILGENINSVCERCDVSLKGCIKTSNLFIWRLSCFNILLESKPKKNQENNVIKFYMNFWLIYD